MCVTVCVCLSVRACVCVRVCHEQRHTQAIDVFGMTMLRVLTLPVFDDSRNRPVALSLTAPSLISYNRRAAQDANKTVFMPKRKPTGLLRQTAKAGRYIRTQSVSRALTMSSLGRS